MFQYYKYLTLFSCHKSIANIYLFGIHLLLLFMHIDNFCFHWYKIGQARLMHRFLDNPCNHRNCLLLVSEQNDIMFRGWCFGSREGVLVSTGMSRSVLGESCTTSIKDFAIFPPHQEKKKKKKWYNVTEFYKRKIGQDRPTHKFLNNLYNQKYSGSWVSCKMESIDNIKKGLQVFPHPIDRN